MRTSGCAHGDYAVLDEASSAAFLQNGYTPLHLACKKGHIDCVSVLIAAGASVDDPDVVRFFGRGYKTV